MKLAYITVRLPFPLKEALDDLGEEVRRAIGFKGRKVDRATLLRSLIRAHTEKHIEARTLVQVLARLAAQDQVKRGRCPKRPRAASKQAPLRSIAALAADPELT